MLILRIPTTLGSLTAAPQLRQQYYPMRRNSYQASAAWTKIFKILKKLRALTPPATTSSTSTQAFDQVCITIWITMLSIAIVNILDQYTAQP